MTKFWAIVVGCVIALGAGTFAHEGHAHTVMGTVSAVVGATQLVVKTTDGKDVTVVVNDKTTVRRGTAKMTLKDVAVGQRVVVNVGEGKTPLVARDIKMGVEPSTRPVPRP
jgi:hypothetical protein